MVAKNAYNDLSKRTVDATPSGNWRLYYDGKDTGLTYNGRLLSDKTIMDYNLEHHGDYDELNEAKAIEKKPTKDVVDLAMDDRVGSNADHSSRMGAEGKTKSARQSPKYRRPSTKVHNIAASLGDLKKGLKK